MDISGTVGVNYAVDACSSDNPVILIGSTRVGKNLRVKVSK